MSEPLAIDLYCGLGGWAEGLLAEGWRVVGFDIEQHDYGTGVYPGQLVIQDVLTLHGSQFKDASLIVASPPCQAYSYRAMPWSRAKALPPPDNSLFDACFRIQREACEATGRYIPLIVENVRGAIKWVSQPVKWHFGSYYLWGDVPALMPMTIFRRTENSGDGDLKDVGGSWDRSRPSHNSDHSWKMNPDGTNHPPGSWFAIADSKNRGARSGQKGIPHRTAGHWTNPAEHEGFKQPGISGLRNNGKGDKWFQDGAAQHGSKSNSRKAASAMIAKIPEPLARHIAQTFKQETA